VQALVLPGQSFPQRNEPGVFGVKRKAGIQRPRRRPLDVCRCRLIRFAEIETQDAFHSERNVRQFPDAGMGNCKSGLGKFRGHRVGLCGAGRGNRFDLTKVVQIVTGHRLDHHPKCHVAALGVIQRLFECLRLESGNQRAVPFANGCENREGLASLIVPIDRGPLVLVEWLDDVMILRQCLAQPEGKNDFAIREVAYDIANAPFTRGRGAIHPIGANCLNEFLKVSRRGSNHFKRISACKVRCVRVHIQSIITIQVILNLL
jgi:hypothetical protein